MEISIVYDLLIYLLCFNMWNMIHICRLRINSIINNIFLALFCYSKLISLSYLISTCHTACILAKERQEGYDNEGFSQQPSPKYYISNDFPYHLFTQDSIKWEVIFLNRCVFFFRNICNFHYLQIFPNFKELFHSFLMKSCASVRCVEQRTAGR